MADVNTTTTGSDAYVVVTYWHKPIGRGRKFERAARGLARRLRLPMVREVRWEQNNPHALNGHTAPSYGWPWYSDNALTDASFACTCHKRERYSRKRGR